MSKISGAIYDIKSMDEMSMLKSPVHGLHPLIKLLTTIIYIFILVSFNKYDLSGPLLMVVYLLAGFILSDLSILESIKKIRIVLPICILLGIFNPFFDHSYFFQLGGLTVTGGMVSGFTLVIKGAFSLLASYLLIATTGIEKICYAFRLLHLPGIIVTQLLLTYRYITVLLTEANNIYQAYSLRAPRQKGVQYKVWGSLLGQLLFRSIDRANEVYEGMLLRGYKGDFGYSNNKRPGIKDIIYILIWIAIFFVIRFTDIFEYITNFFS